MKAYLYVTFWISISCAMILFNKAVLSQFSFPYPMFLTTYHMLLSTLLTQLMAKFTNWLPGVQAKKVDRAIMKSKIFPVAIFFAISLVFANKAYIYLSVSFIQMLKAFTPVSVLIISYALRLEKSSVMELNIVSVISVGVAMTSIGELAFSWVGFTFQAVALLAESGRLVLTNILMKELKLDPLSALYYIAPVCCGMIGLAFLVFEFQIFPFERLLSPMFLLMLLANGLVAFTLNIAVVMLIGNTSALILTLAGIVKDLMLVFLSVAVFDTPVTQLQYLGYTVALLGLNLHKEFKKSFVVPAEKPLTELAQTDAKPDHIPKTASGGGAVNTSADDKDEKV